MPDEFVEKHAFVLLEIRVINRIFVNIRLFFGMHIELHYLPSLAYMSLLTRRDESHLFEIMEHFPKQTYRNRCQILGANGVEVLSVPVLHVPGQKAFTKDIQIDYSQAWVRRHMGAIQAAYGKAPFFEHFEPFIQAIFAKKNKFLVDLNIDFLKLSMKILSKGFDYSLTDDFLVFDGISFYNQIQAKRDTEIINSLVSMPYRQCFGTDFVPNLSILDVLMNHGRESSRILEQMNIN
jgi:hypothetical protein